MHSRGWSHHFSELQHMMIITNDIHGTIILDYFKKKIEQSFNSILQQNFLKRCS